MPDVVSDAQIGSASSTPVMLRQVTNSSFDPHVEVLNARESGSGVIKDQFIQSASPEASLTTVDIGGFLTAFGTIGGQTDGANVILPWQKRKSGGTFQSGALNTEIFGVATCPVQLVPHSINAPRQGAPTAQGSLHFLSFDGILSPFTQSLDQSLPTQAFNAMYGLGPCFINTVQVPRQVGFTVTFGVGLSEKQHYDGSIYPSDIFLETFDPVIEIQVEDFDQLVAIGLMESITEVSCYLRKRLSGGTYALDTSATAIKFSFALDSVTGVGGVVTAQGRQASETKHGNAAIRLTGRTLVVTNGVNVTN